MCIVGILLLTHKSNTGSCDPGMASLLEKIDLHADSHMLIFFPLLHLSVKNDFLSV